MSPLPGSAIAELNDAFRRSWIGGTILFTAGVSSLSPFEQVMVVGLVRRFDAFDAGNDPYGEHDFGAVEHAGTRYFWKIDYYDLKLEEGSPNPADPAVTWRVMTIMRAEEY